MFNVNRFNPNNPGAYSADDGALAQLAMALGQRMQREPERGQMVSGWYVPPSRGAGVANVLSNVLGTYMQAQGMQAQAESKKEQAKAFAHALKMLREPGADEEGLAQDLEQARTNPRAFTYAKPQDVGPQEEPVAQSFPVEDRRQFVQMRDLPKTAPSAGPLARAQAAATAPTMAPQQALMQAKRELMSDEGAAGLSVGEFNARVQQRANELMAPKAAPVPTAPVAQAAPQPAQAAPLAAVQAAQALVAAPAPEPTFNYDRAAHEQQVGQAARGLSRAQEARRAQAIELLGNSGERGQKFADAILAAQLSGKGGDEYSTTSLGDGQYVTTSKKTGATSVGGMGGTRKQDQQNLESRLKIDGLRTEARAEVDGAARALDAINRAEQAVTKYGPKFGGVLGKARLSAGLLAGENDAVEFNNALKAVSLANLKATFGGNTSNVELLQLAEQFGSDGSVPEDVLRSKLMAMRQSALRGKNTFASRITNLDAEWKRAGGDDAGPAAAPATKSGLDWMPAR